MISSLVDSLTTSTSDSTESNRIDQTNQSISNKRPRRASTIRPQQPTSPPPSPVATCQKCSKKSGQLVKCVKCDKCYHKSCVLTLGETETLGGHRNDFSDWLCLTCEQSQLIECLELKLKEIEANSWRAILLTETEDASDQEMMDEQPCAAAVAEEPVTLVEAKKKSIINFDSPIKEGIFVSKKEKNSV